MLHSHLGWSFQCPHSCRVLSLSDSHLYACSQFFACSASNAGCRDSWLLNIGSYLDSTCTANFAVSSGTLWLSVSSDADSAYCDMGVQDGVVVDKLQGANAPELANKVAKWAGPNTAVSAAAPASVGLAAGPNVLEAVKKELVPPSGDTPSKSAANDSLPEVQKGELHKLVNSRPVMLFMKGTPEEPRCAFSRKVVDALQAVGAEFGSFDILSDETVRQSMKVYSNWPTFPQLYAKGELIGGCDIVLEMQQSGELKEVCGHFTSYCSSYFLNIIVIWQNAPFVFLTATRLPVKSTCWGYPYLFI